MALLLLSILAQLCWAGTTPPGPIVLSGGQATRRSLALTWTAPGDDGSTGTAASYDLRSSLIGPIDSPAKFSAATPVAGVPAPKPAGSAESFTVTGLNAATTYYFALRALDEVPNPSALSNALTLVTSATAPPSAVDGLRGARDEANGNFLLSWSAIQKYSDGTPLDGDFSRYAVFRATALTGPFSPLAELSTGTLSFSHAGGLAASAFYQVRAQDIFGGSSTVRACAISDADTTLIFLSADGLARLEVPARAQAPLFAAQNSFGSDLRGLLTRDLTDEGGKVLRSWKLSLVRTLDAAEVSATLPQPGAQLHLLAPAGTAISQTAIFQFNGVDFTKLGGSPGPDPGPGLRVAVTETGRYRLEAALRPSQFSVSRLVPSKVFTPNGDGINDVITVFFENPSGEVVSGEVFDVTGRRVAALKQGPTRDSLSWDGSSGGGSARGGIYIYRVTGGEKTFRGTMVLVR